MSKLYVLKYGGKTIATPSLIKKRAKYISSLYQQGHKVIVVVSAMGDTTDNLYSLANQISDKPTTRELDVLLTSGERISMALMTIALQEEGCDAISFTGSQAGILTHGSHSTSYIKEIKPIRVEDELKKNKIIVIAGFQGVDPTSKDITTLGRGGSDTTALALANYFKTDNCFILKDVDGVYDKDPAQNIDAKKINLISTEQLKEITLWGAKLCHYKAAEQAHNSNQSYYIGSADNPNENTFIQTSNPKAQIMTAWDCVVEFTPNTQVDSFLKNYDLIKLPSTNSYSYWAGEKKLLTSLQKDVLDKYKVNFKFGTSKTFHFAESLTPSMSNNAFYKSGPITSVFEHL